MYQLLAIRFSALIYTPSLINALLVVTNKSNRIKQVRAIGCGIFSSPSLIKVGDYRPNTGRRCQPRHQYYPVKA